MPPGSRKRKDRRRREAESVDEDQASRSIGRGHHIHIHEIHGREMVRHLRRPYIVALGYRPDP